jgi:hypothetical protein
MGVYAYCVVPTGFAVPQGLTGLDGAGVELFDAGDVALWVTRGDRPDPGIAAIRVHNAVVEAAVTEEVTPLPLRFGQWLADDAALRAAVAEKTTSYRQRLADFAGCLEFGIRLVDPAEPAATPNPQPGKAATGAAYMRALQESSRLAEQKRTAAESVHAAVRSFLQPVVREEKVEETRTAHAVLTLSHLVARSDFDAYRERARDIREQFPDLRMLLSGPWPPYSFAV